MKTYLITGGAGFIGRAVAREFRDAGHAVRVLDNFDEQVHGPLGGGRGRDVIEGDIRNPDDVRAALKGVDGVVHLAAQVGVGQSMYEISRYVGVNELGTAVLLEALIDNPVSRIVVASSMSIYGEGLYQNPAGELIANARRNASDIKAGRWELFDSSGQALRPVPTDEEKPADLASIYALNKYQQERATLIFGNAYSMDAVALRLFNVFGPGQALSNPYTGVLANFGSRLVHRQRPLIFEDGRQQRDFVHVNDVARAFRLAMEAKEAHGQVFNVGSGRSYSIADVAVMLSKALGAPEITPEVIGKSRSGDIRNCFADITKARDLLGFQPLQTLEDSMDELARWILAEESVDRGQEMRKHLEERGLVV